MPTSQLSKLTERLRRAALQRGGAGLTDAQLLDGFVERQDGAALEALVCRHGPMVLGVCRRVTGNHHDAEDAFQAAFLVLVRKAGSIVPREMVGSWLYGVAYNTARKARAATTKRRARERRVAQMPEPEAAPNDPWDDLRPLLDQELSRLPEQYRVPVVLCDLEGKTRKEAARQLGWPEGTLSSRLARARAVLAERLTRRGLVLSAGVVAAVVSQNASSASVPPALASSLARAAELLAAGQAAAAGVIPAEVAALTEGVMNAMLLPKLKIAAWEQLVLASTLAGAVIGWGTGYAFGRFTRSRI